MGLDFHSRSDAFIRATCTRVVARRFAVRRQVVVEGEEKVPFTLDGPTILANPKPITILPQSAKC